MKTYEIIFALSLLLILCLCIYNTNRCVYSAKKGTCSIGKNIETLSAGGNNHDAKLKRADPILMDNGTLAIDEMMREPFSVGCSSCTKKEHFDVGGPFLDGSKKCRVTMIWADWCGYSNKAKPEWDEVIKEYQGTDINGYKLELKAVEEKEFKENKDLVNKFNVEGFPSFYVELSDKDKIVDFNSIEKDDMYAKIQKSINEILRQEQTDHVDNSDETHNKVQIDANDNNVHANNFEGKQYAPIALALEGSQLPMPPQKQLQLKGIDAVQSMPVAYNS